MHTLKHISMYTYVNSLRYFYSDHSQFNFIYIFTLSDHKYYVIWYISQ